MADPPGEPPLPGTDVEHLVGTLERLRATVGWKADGPSGEQRRTRAVPTSGGPA